MLVCLSGAGLLPSYENFSLILEKLPPTIGYLTLIFQTQVEVRFMTKLENQLSNNQLWEEVFRV